MQQKANPITKQAKGTALKKQVEKYLVGKFIG
jgi:hypothetical protein